MKRPDHSKTGPAAAETPLPQGAAPAAPDARPQTDAEPAPVAGQVAILGRPNVGKSVLLNQIVGQKLAIVSPRPQTTRNRILGVWNGPEGQIVFVDTPGIHRHSGALNRFMNDEALSVVENVDVVLLVTDAAATLAHAGRRPITAAGATREDERVLAALGAAGRPVVLALNKVDLVKNKPALFPLLEHWQGLHAFSALVPISAMRGSGVSDLVRTLLRLLPPGPPLYDPDTLTDRSERFLVAELIREQLFVRLFDELPYSVAVQIDQWTERPAGDVVIDATILVEKESQKVIAVGKGGRMVRDIGTAARAEISQLLGRPAHLKLFVKVAPDWTTSTAALRDLGYEAKSR